MARPLTRAEKIAWARLARTPRIGAVTFARLLAAHHDAAEALTALARRDPNLAAQAPAGAALERELDAVERLGAQWLCAVEPDYPPLLAALEAPPPFLAAWGDPALAARRPVAVVGARDASAAGLRLAETLAQGLSQAGCAVVSGLARGVDARAHAASLSGGAVAVTAGGLDQPYPPENAGLHAAIAAQGLILTDAPFGHAPRARDFPRCNAVIAGVSHAVVVVEASLRSGSLMTARHAADLGRDVMAIPGSPLESRSRGANALIKEGAALVEDAQDVLAALGAPRVSRAPAPPPEIESAPTSATLLSAVAAALTVTPLHLNDIARAVQAPAQAVAAALVELELSGQAVSEPGGYASRVG